LTPQKTSAPRDFGVILTQEKANPAGEHMGVAYVLSDAGTSDRMKNGALMPVKAP
jgi:hypothetical protein